jgi:hypothetical protein
MLNPRRIADQVLRLSQQLSLAFGCLSRKVQARNWTRRTLWLLLSPIQHRTMGWQRSRRLPRPMCNILHTRHLTRWQKRLNSLQCHVFTVLRASYAECELLKDR